MKIALVIFITLALAGCALLSLHMGVIPVPWRALLTDWQAGHEHYYVLMEYRLPRLLLALFVGAALAVAGVLIQGIVRNPLASPDILGVNHAASLASVGALLLMPSLPVMVLPLLAFAGGMAGLILLKMLAKTHQPMKLALTGVALSACWFRGVRSHARYGLQPASLNASALGSFTHHAHCAGKLAALSGCVVRSSGQRTPHLRSRRTRGAQLSATV